MIEHFVPLFHFSLFLCFHFISCFPSECRFKRRRERLIQGNLLRQLHEQEECCDCLHSTVINFTHARWFLLSERLSMLIKLISKWLVLLKEINLTSGFISSHFKITIRIWVFISVKIISFVVELILSHDLWSKAEEKSCGFVIQLCNVNSARIHH